MIDLTQIRQEVTRWGVLREKIELISDSKWRSNSEAVKVERVQGDLIGGGLHFPAALSGSSCSL